MKAALVGKGISYTMSNKIHKLIGEINNFNIEYSIKDFDEGSFEDFFNKESYLTYNGLNITTPFKEKAFDYMHLIDENVRLLKVVNTIKVDDNFLIGYNTDYLAFKEMVKEIDFENKEVYILGTGGAAKVCYQVFKEMKFKITVVSRSIKRKKPFKKIISYEKLNKLKNISTIVNATPVGNLNNKGCLVDSNDKNIDLVIDLNYNPKQTELMRLAKRSYNGLKMLILQAIYAEEIWLDRELKRDELTIKLIEESLDYE